MPIISIIVPVYNTEKYLHRCIDSILAQTYTDFELLLVDDGSTDSSGAICDEYALRDSRVRVFHKENGGVSSARNLGLDNAQGEWITFVDSDDWVNVKYIEHLYECVSNEIDMIFSYATIYTGSTKYKENYPSYIACSTDIDVMFDKNDLHWHTSPWAKLYKKELINQNSLRFDNAICVGEDLVFVYSYILVCKRIYISNITDYNYNNIVTGSLTQRVFRFESELYGLHRITGVVKDLEKYGHINSHVSKLKVDWVIGCFTRRVLNSIYHNEFFSRKKRISEIKKMDLSSYINSHRYGRGKERLLIVLLQKKWFAVYDFIRFMSVFKKRK